MKEVYTKDFVLQILRNVLEFERGTRDLYRDYLGRLSSVEVRAVFTRLSDEEARHVKSVEALIERLN